MAEKIKKQIKKYCRAAIAMALILTMITVYENISPARAASVGNRSVKISDSRPTQTGAAYDVKGDYSGTTVKCLQVQFCTAATGACTVPTGMTTTAGTRNDANWVGWTVANWTGVYTTNGTVQYTYVTGEAGAAARTFSVANITNPTSAATYYGRISTFTDTGCSAAADSGTAAFAVISGVSVTATVAETLTFSIAGVASSTTQKTGVVTTVATPDGTSVPLGNLSTGANAIAGHNLTVSTNAQGGYTTTVKYTGQLAAGANTIADHTGTNATPTAFPAAGNEAFGYTTDATPLGTGTTTRFGSNNVWAGFTTSPLEVAYSAAPVNSAVTKIAYQAGISGTTKAGSYSTTVIYVTTPIF